MIGRHSARDNMATQITVDADFPAKATIGRYDSMSYPPSTHSADHSDDAGRVLDRKLASRKGLRDNCVSNTFPDSTTWSSDLLGTSWPWSRPASQEQDRAPPWRPIARN